MLAFVLVGSFVFATTDTELVKDNIKIEIKTEISETGSVTLYVITMDEFDICTITVTITTEEGVVARGRATSHTGDCDAARDAAEASARATLESAGF